MMKYLIIFPLFFMTLNAIAVEVECFKIQKKNDSVLNQSFRCSSAKSSFSVTGVNNPNILKKAMDLVPSKIILPFDKEKVHLNTFLNRLAFHHPYPQHGKWLLPEITLMALQNLGVHTIQGHLVTDVIRQARQIRWEDMKNIFKFFRFDPSRHTGRYNSYSKTVTYGGHDILNHDIADIQQWALHETFGTIGIEDDNYKLSTLATLLNESQIDISTFRNNQYFDLENQFPALPDVMGLHFDILQKEGGVTGVEGGGDIVSASIKRYMIIGRQWETGFKVSQAEITEIMDYNIRYSEVYVLSRYSENYDLIDHPHIYTFFQDNEIYITLKEEFRKSWIYLPHPQKVQIAREIRSFIEEDYEKYKLEVGEKIR